MQKTKTPTDSDQPIIPMICGPLISLKSTLDRPGIAAKEVKTLDDKFEEEPHSGASLSPKMKILIAELSYKHVFSKCKMHALDPEPPNDGKLPSVTDMNHIRIDNVPQHVLEQYSHDPNEEPEEDNGVPEASEEVNGRDITNGRESTREKIRVLSHDPNADVFICEKNGAMLACCADNPICTCCNCEDRFLSEPKNVATA